MDQPMFSDDTTSFTPDPSVPILAAEPTQIGRYRVVKLLGKGGFGSVYLAHDDDLNRLVAIKTPLTERVAKSKDIEAYLEEARMAASLDHPQIVPVYDVGRTDDGLCFVVSKFIEGSDLATKIKDRRPGLHESTELIATIAEALHHAYTRGLVHRDIKPSNLLIDMSGKAFVADFGLALKDEDIGKYCGLTGTPAYMSPEQARGEGHLVDGRSDIFSLGVIFYELLTGRLPFRAHSHSDIRKQIISLEPRPPRQIDDSIPNELERICCKAMAKAFSDRYTTAKDMAEDLRRHQEAYVDRKIHPIGLADDTPTHTPEPVVNSTPPERIRRLEFKSILGRAGCVIQLTTICSFFVGVKLLLDAVTANISVVFGPNNPGDEIQFPFSLGAVFGTLLIAVPASYLAYQFVRSVLR